MPRRIASPWAATEPRATAEAVSLVGHVYAVEFVPVGVGVGVGGAVGVEPAPEGVTPDPPPPHDTNVIAARTATAAERRNGITTKRSSRTRSLGDASERKPHVGRHFVHRTRQF